jgi:hypothetical protein
MHRLDHDQKMLHTEYARLLAERDLLTCRAQMIRFGAWLGVARSHRRAGLLS